MSLISFIAGLVSCAASERVYSGDAGGERVTVDSVTSRNPMDFSRTPVLQVGNLPALQMRFAATTRGAPYSLDIYEGYRLVVLEPELIEAYGSQRGATSGDVVNVVLYLDPARFSQEQFDRYAEFFRQHWPALRATVPLRQDAYEINVAALVHGTDSEFVRTYRHPDDSTGHLEIWTDGYVHYRVQRGSRSTNLGQWVLMPGYRITVDGSPNPMALADIPGYVDGDGRSIAEDFALETQ